MSRVRKCTCAAVIDFSCQGTPALKIFLERILLYIFTDTTWLVGLVGQYFVIVSHLLSVLVY